MNVEQILTDVENRLCTGKTDRKFLNNKLANQRTYIAFTSSALALAALAGAFKQSHLVYIALAIILLSAFQYYIINKNLTNDEGICNFFFDHMPLMYMVLALLVLYLQYNKG